jgi:isopenicillin-N N-acyltransferase like protein
MPLELRDPLVDVSGSPREMGLQHGRQLRARIHHTVEGLRERLGPEPYDASWEDAQKTLTYCRDAAPELVAEMEAIAEGAQIDLRHIFNINAHLDLFNWRRFVWDERAGREGACSSHAVATDSEVLLGWNGDDWRGWMGSGMVVRGRPDEGPPFIYWSLAGCVGRPGLGAHLALGANSILGDSWRADGLLYPMLCRKLLACTGVQDAVSLFGKYNRCAAMNYLIADGHGMLVDVESLPDRIAVMQPDPHTPLPHLLHSNSTLASELPGGGPEAESCPRLAAARRLYAEDTPTDAPGVAAVLRDHTGGICVHTPQSCTLVSFVAEVRAGRFHVARGNPCRAPLTTYALARES